VPEEWPDQMRLATDAMIRRDFDRFVEFFDPDAEVSPLVSELDGTVYQGHNGIRTWWNNLIAVFPNFVAEVIEVRDLGDEFLTVTTFQGDDASIELTMWTLVALRNGKIAGWRSFRTEGEALEAAA
jgi:hypothetical protein